MEVLVFKTNITDHHHVNHVRSYLNLHPYIFTWNVDLHDCDNILRIETNKLSGKEVEIILINAGYYCEEL